MTTMKKWIALLLTLTLLLSFTACMGGTDKPDATDPDDTGASAELTENGSAADPSAAFDVGSLNWVDGELDCYGYKGRAVPRLLLPPGKPGRDRERIPLRNLRLFHAGRLRRT